LLHIFVVLFFVNVNHTILGRWRTMQQLSTTIYSLFAVTTRAYYVAIPTPLQLFEDRICMYHMPTRGCKVGRLLEKLIYRR